MGRKEELARELDDKSREMSDHVAKAEQVRDERNAEIDIIENIPDDLDPDDRAAVDAAAEGVRSESSEDFETNVEARQTSAEDSMSEIGSSADSERTKVEGGAQQLEQVGGPYGRSDVGAARSRLEASAATLEGLSRSARETSDERRSEIDAARADLR